MSAAKFKLQTKALYCKQLESQMLDLWHEKIQTKKELKIIIEKIPDYKIHEESVSFWKSKVVSSLKYFFRKLIYFRRKNEQLLYIR